MRLKDQTLDLLDQLEGARVVAPALREFHARLEAFLRAVVATPTSIDEPGSLPLSDAEKELGGWRGRMKRTPGQTLDERAKAVLGMYGDPVAFVGPARDLIRELLALVAVMDETAESLALAHER